MRHNDNHKRLTMVDRDNERLDMSLAPKGSLLLTGTHDDYPNLGEVVIYLDPSEVVRLKEYLSTPVGRGTRKRRMDFVDPMDDRLTVSRTGDGWCTWLIYSQGSSPTRCVLMRDSKWDDVLDLLKDVS